MLAAATVVSPLTSPHSTLTPALYTSPRTSGAYGWDKALFLDINHFARDTRWLHFPLHQYAQLGVWLLGALLVAGWWLARRDGPAKAAASLWAGAGALLALAVSEPVNRAVAEARPWQSMPDIMILVGRTHDFSFPSGDAVIAGAVTAGLLLFHRRLGAVAAAAGLLDCFAWVYIGDHYPQDVIGGFVLGVLVSLLGYAAVRIPLTAAVRALSATPLRPLLAASPPSPAHQPSPPPPVPPRDTSAHQAPPGGPRMHTPPARPREPRVHEAASVPRSARHH